MAAVPTRPFAIETIAEGACAAEGFHAVFRSAARGPADGQGDVRAGAQLAHDGAEVLRVGRLPDLRHDARGIRDARVRGDPIDLAEVPADEIDEMHAHV